eukprot:scaffold93350_cov54-Phaeocystis_antarctica.AAC.1
MVLQERGVGRLTRMSTRVRRSAKDGVPPRLRMWFNGWLCDLAPVAAAVCGRGRLHVRLLWSCRSRVSSHSFRLGSGE